MQEGQSMLARPNPAKPRAGGPLLWTRYGYVHKLPLCEAELVVSVFQCPSPGVHHPFVMDGSVPDGGDCSLGATGTVVPVLFCVLRHMRDETGEASDK